MTTKVHWTQTPEGKKKLSEGMKKAYAAKRMKKEPRKYTARQPKKEAAALVINGWRISLGKDAIKIERE